MSQNHTAISNAVSTSGQNSSPEALLLRYAAGRLRSIWPRIAMYGVGSLVVGVFAAPYLAVVTISMALVGEALDCGFCSRAERLLRAGVSLRTLQKVSVATAVIQSASQAACIMIAWFFIQSHNAVFFSLAYLSGAAMNAGIFMPLNPSATKGRLLVFAAALAAILTLEFVVYEGFVRENILDILGVGIMSLMVYLFLSHVMTSHRKQSTARQKLLASAEQLKSINHTLEQRQSELRNLAMVARHANDSVIITDPAGCITWVNDGFSRTTGYDFADAIGRTTGDLLNGPATSQETTDAISRALSEGQTFRTEILNYTKGGAQIWVETNLVPVLDAFGEVETVVAIERDISRAKEHETKLAAAMEEAKQAAQAKADFLATMSHEIRTPMNAILGMAELLSEKQLDDEGQLYTETIRSSATALLRIINDVLDLSKLDAGMPTVSNVDFDLRACLTSATAMFRPLVVEKGLEMQVSMPPDMPNWVNGDDGRLRQVLVNIIGNAIKFTACGAIKIDISHRADGLDTLLRVNVCDLGIGIAPDDLARIFDKFSQAQSDTARKFGGTGLGLTISRLLAQEMGGDITATSVPDKGSLFSIVVRLSPATSDHKTAVPNVDQLVALLPEGLRVLVAEDNATNRLIVQKFLRGSGVVLDFAHDGRQAISMALETAPDIIMMDMSMPEVDGLEATRHIRASGLANTRIVALTANAHAGDKARCIRAGMDGFLSKPLRKIDLLATLVEFSELDQVAEYPLKTTAG